MLGNRIGSMQHILHIRWIETHHQLFDLFLVFIIHVMYVEVNGHKLRSEDAPVLLHGLHIPIEHREEFKRVQLLTLELHLHVQQLVAD